MICRGFSPESAAPSQDGKAENYGGAELLTACRTGSSERGMAEPERKITSPRLSPQFSASSASSNLE